MRSKCREKARDRSIAPGPLVVRASIVAAITIGSSFLAADADQNSTTSKILLAQAQSDDGGTSGGSTKSGGTTTRSSGMSDRIKKYMGEDQGPGPGPGVGSRPGGGGGDMDSRRERMRQMFDQMPPEKREKMMQEFKERRMRRGGGGMPDGPPPGGPDGGPPGGPPGGGPPGFMGGPDGGPPDGGPPFAGRGGDGPPDFGGFKRGNGIRNYGSGGKGGMKAGKFFGREPLDLTVLNLTPEQKTKIQAMRTVDGQKSRQLSMELHQKRDKFKDLLFDPSATPDQIMGVHRDIAKLQNQTQEIMVNDFLGIRKLLTKEQLELLPQVRPEEARRPSPRPPGGRKGFGDEPAVSQKGNDT